VNVVGVQQDLDSLVDRLREGPVQLSITPQGRIALDFGDRVPDTQQRPISVSMQLSAAVTLT
jgi:hypothetical protein